MNNRNKIFIFFLLIICILGIRYSSEDREITQLEKIIAEFFRPAQQFAMENTRKIIVFMEGVSSYPAVREENERLQEQLDKYQMELQREKEFYFENIRLRKLLEMEMTSTLSLQAADVIGRSIKSWDDVLIINKGEEDGVDLYDGVMTYRGLVGKVFYVGPHTAQVRLLNNRLGSVPAMTEQTRFPGVIEGIGDGSGLLQLTYLPYDAPVEVNQTIITSGLGELIPKGIRIGYVSSIQYNEDGLIKKAIVTPFEDFNRLEEVLIIEQIHEVSP